MQILRALSVIALLMLTSLLPTPVLADDVVATHNDQRSLPELLESAQHGDGGAMNNVGMHYVNGQGIPVDYAKAMYWFQKAYKAGVAGAAGSIGVLYSGGLGVKQDYAAAMKWHQTAWEMSCRDNTDQGKDTAGLAANNIGVLYYRGYGVKQDLNKAFGWYQKGMDRGSNLALFNMAILLWNYGNQEQKNSAIGLWQEAARIGDNDAQNALRQRGYKW